MINVPEPDQKVLKRYSPPTKYDHAPYGQRCLVIEGDQIETYIQTSHDEDNPVWESTGPFLKKQGH